MSVKHIAIITAGYPTPDNPSRYPFVDQLACAFADMGIEISVITPVPYGKKKRYGYCGKCWEKRTLKGNSLTIYQPRMVSFSSRRIGGLDTGEWTFRSFTATIQKQIRHLPQSPHILYAHFLPSGMTAAKIGNTMGIPAFCAFGESGLWSIEGMGIKKAAQRLTGLSGIVSVTSENKRLLTENGIFPKENIEVFPNGVDHNVFFPRDKQAMRKKFGFPSDSIIGIFVGAFDERKGSLRVAAATSDISNLKMIYIGAGNAIPRGDNILYCGKAPHSDIPEYLSAADFFILPTRSEGCCNAIIEAIACGLPVISSDGPFNDDILEDAYSIRISAYDISTIRNAIKRITESTELRHSMSIASIKKSKSQSIIERAARIVAWMKDNMNMHRGGN